MPREVPSGTPTRSPRYIFPASGRKLLWASVAAGVVLLAAIIGLYFAGVRQFASPGDLATQHAPIDLKCALCHGAADVRGVADVRCERCHDPGGAERLTNAAHVQFGSGDALKAERAEAVPCVQCHTDHRGRGFQVARVDDRECARCHGFRALSGHPEFAIVKAAIQTGTGLDKFNHDRHVVDVQREKGQPCTPCHVQTTDLTSFQSISFDKNCAGSACHTNGEYVKNETEAISPEQLVGISPAADSAEPPRIAEALYITVKPAARGRVQLGNFRHRDPWVLTNVVRLRRAIDPEGESAERAAVRGQLAYLQQQLESTTIAGTPRRTLDEWVKTLETEIAGIDARLAAGGGEGSDRNALEELASAVRAVAKAVAAANPPAPEGQEAREVATEAVDLSAAPAAPAESDSARFERRKAELLAVLQAIEGRGDAKLAERAAALRARVERLSPGDGGEPDRAALRRSLESLDDVFRAVRAVPDPEANVEAARLRILRELAAQRVGGGLSPDDFDARRVELLSLLDAIERQGEEALRRRAAALRQRVLALRPGTYGDEGLRRARAGKAKVLDRIRLEIELLEAGEANAPAVAAPGRDRDTSERTLARLRAQLALLDGGPRPGVAASLEERAERVKTLATLVGPCTKCHDLRGPAIAPVAAAEVVMPRSIFNHRPHVTQTKCESCHASILTSTKAFDVNVPGLANCQQCHKPSQTRADCATCHVYHPPSVARLLRTL